MKQKVDQLKKLARPYLVKLETPENSEKDISGGTGHDEAVAANAALVSWCHQGLLAIF